MTPHLEPNPVADLDPRDLAGDQNQTESASDKPPVQRIPLKDALVSVVLPVTAVVTPKPGVTVTPEEIVVHCKKTIAAYKVPKKVFIQEALPKSNVGKILKKRLKRKYIDAFT